MAKDTRAGRAVFEISLDDKQYRVAISGLGKEGKRAADNLRGIRQAVDLQIFTQLGRVGVQAISAIGRELVQLASRGAEVSALRGSFESLTASVGETSTAMMGELRGATQGLVDDMTLMEATNKAILLGLPVTTESMGTMARAAVTLGRAMGQDAAKSLDDLTTALGRGSPLILDNLGLTVKVGEANEAYAQKLGKTVTQLTEAEKKMAFYEAAMEAARSKVAELGEVQLTFGDRLKQAEIFLANFRDRLAEAVSQSPVLAAGLEAAGKGMMRAFGGDTQSAVDTSLELIEGIAIAVVQAGQVAATAANFMLNAWHGLKVGFNEIMAAMVGGLGTFLNSLASALEMQAKLPVVGAQYQGLADSVRAAGEDLQHLSLGFEAQADTALDSAASTNAFMESVRQMLAETESAMRGAESASTAAAAGIQQTTREAGAAAAETAALTKQQAAELKRLEEQRRREAEAAATLIADTERRLQQELALAQTTGLQQRLLEIQFAKEAELAEIAHLREGYAAEYAQLAAMINQKYEGIRLDAQRTHTSIESMAAQQGFKTRAELEATAQKAVETYQRMLASGKFTIDTLQAAHEAAEEAKRAASGETEEFQLSSGEAIVKGSLQIFEVLGQKFKAAAIAGAIISTYQAVAKALASAPWPANLPLAAGALAAGMANVARIRSSDAGWRHGTPGLDFKDFGPMSMEPLHGPEAVIPQGRGHLLAGEIADAMPNDDEMALLELRAIRAGIDALPQTMKRAMRDARLFSQ